MPRLDGENIVFGTVLSGTFHDFRVQKRGRGGIKCGKKCKEKKGRGREGGYDDDANYDDYDVMMTMIGDDYWR